MGSMCEIPMIRKIYCLLICSLLGKIKKEWRPHGTLTMQVILRGQLNLEQKLIAIIFGLKCLENFGAVGNKALAQVKHPITADGRSRRFELTMNTTEFYPSQPAYNISYSKLTSKALGACVLVTATSDFFIKI